MARTRSVRLHVGSITVQYDDIHPEQLWEPGHDVYDWCKSIGEQLVSEARATAPGGNAYSTARWPRTGTGRLKAGIGVFSHRTGEESYEIILGSDAPYTKFVHGGTAFQRGAFIYSHAGSAHAAEINAFMFGQKSIIGVQPSHAPNLMAPHPSWYMRLPPGGGFTWPYQLRVRGQRANPFLVRAYNRVQEIHAGLPSTLGDPWTGVVGRVI